MLVILLTAPLGAMCIAVAGPAWLACDVGPTEVVVVLHKSTPREKLVHWPGPIAARSQPDRSPVVPSQRDD